MSDLTFSIIIPVYNAEQYLRRCVDSVLAQSYTDFELLLIDDGSRDQSPAICDEYAATDRRVLVFHKPNGGVSSARNLGLDNAKGEYLVFWDADDYVPHNTLEVFDNAIHKYGADVVIGQYQEISTDGTVINQTNPLDKETLFDHSYITQSILRYAISPNSFFGSCWVKTFRRKVFTQHSIRFPNRRRAEDWIVNIEFLKQANSAVAINDVVYYYVRNDQSAMSKPFPEQVQLWEESMELELSLIAQYNYDIDLNEIKATFLENVFEHLLKIANYSGVKGCKEAQIILEHQFITIVCSFDTKIQPIPMRTKVFKYLVKRGFLSAAYYFVCLWLSLSKVKNQVKHCPN